MSGPPTGAGSLGKGLADTVLICSASTLLIPVYIQKPGGVVSFQIRQSL